MNIIREANCCIAVEPGGLLLVRNGLPLILILSKIQVHIVAPHLLTFRFNIIPIYKFLIKSPFRIILRFDAI
jgi:hypothetical protein